jgi:hypothetical protein
VTIARTCVCGRRIEAGRSCVCGRGTERGRLARDPSRAYYTHPSYRRNRAARYDLVRGLCENCGAPLRGKLHPRGKPWQCDHHLEARLFVDAETANAIENLRCYCTGRGGCHSGRRKPK